MSFPPTSLHFSFRAVEFALLLLFPVVGNAAADARSGSASTAAATAHQAAACTLFPKDWLEQAVGWELRDGKPKDASPGLSQCDFTVPPKAYQTRRFPNPPLPDAAGLSSIVITTFPTTPDTFEQSRRTMGTENVDLPGRTDAGSFLNGPAMIYVRSGNRGCSIRLHVETPKTDTGRTRLREVMMKLGAEAVKVLPLQAP